MNDNDIEKFLLNENCSIKDAMNIIDKNGFGVAFLIDDERKLAGVISDGDIRRAILSGIAVENKVSDIANKNPIIINIDKHDLLKAKEEIRKKMPIIAGSLKIPVLDKENKIKGIVLAKADEKNNPWGFRFFSQKKEEPVKKVLVIGGAGYLGSILCEKLLEKNYNVRVLDNLTFSDTGIRNLYANDKFEFIKGDIRDISNIVKALRGMDAVIHLAAIVGDPACSVNPTETLEINYLATRNIVEACKYFQINRFIFSSTCSVYGKSLLGEKALTEKCPLNPVSLYAQTKIKCEESILKTMDENFSPTIFRMATLYGYSPNMRFDLSVNLLAAKAFFEKKIDIFGGDQWRPWLHIEDAANAYINCLEAPIEKVKGEIFNVVSENYKIIDIAQIIKSVFPDIAINIEQRREDQRNYNVSFVKILEKFNYNPQRKLIDGIKEIRNIFERGAIKDYRAPAYRTCFHKD